VPASLVRIQGAHLAAGGEAHSRLARRPGKGREVEPPCRMAVIHTAIFILTLDLCSAAEADALALKPRARRCGLGRPFGPTHFWDLAPSTPQATWQRKRMTPIPNSTTVGTGGLAAAHWRRECGATAYPSVMEDGDHGRSGYNRHRAKDKGV